MSKLDDFVKGIEYVETKLMVEKQSQNRRLIAQRWIGLLILLLGLISIFVLDFDITAAPMLMLLGSYLIFTSTKYLN